MSLQELLTRVFLRVENAIDSPRSPLGPGRINWMLCLLFAILAVFAVKYQMVLAEHIEWGDESETIVAARMIVSGSSLYGEIFNHHGPLTFLPGVLLEHFGHFGVQGHRVPIFVLQWLALASIFWSPLLRHALLRFLYTAVATVVMLSAFSKGVLFGHTYIYQNIAGLLLVIILAQYTLPAMLPGHELSGVRISLGNFLIGLLPFIAVTYVPLSVLLFLGSLRAPSYRRSLAWFCVGIVCSLGFLAAVGSLRGFLAFHLYLNACILPLYNGGETGWKLIQNMVTNSMGGMHEFAVSVLIAAGLYRISTREPGAPWRSLLTCAAVCSLLIREIVIYGIPGWDGHPTWNGLPYFYCAMTIPLVFFQDIVPALRLRLLTIALMMVFIAKMALLLPHEEERITSRAIPRTTEFSRLVSLLTTEHDRIIAYSFRNFEYIASDRLPASGHYFYLPWQEKYNENPKFGVKIDACSDIALRRPRIMLMDKWKVWGKFTWESYAGCLQDLIDREYVQIPDKPYYVRKDLLYDDSPTSSGGASAVQVAPGKRSSTGASADIHMTAAHQQRGVALKSMHLILEVQRPQRAQDVRLSLEGLNGERFTQTFTLTDVSQGAYRRFDLNPGRYVAGRIDLLGPGSISTVEVHSGDGPVHTCVILEYLDGKTAFTPGCPLP